MLRDRDFPPHAGERLHLTRPRNRQKCELEPKGLLRPAEAIKHIDDEVNGRTHGDAELVHIRDWTMTGKTVAPAEIAAEMEMRQRHAALGQFLRQFPRGRG